MLNHNGSYREEQQLDGKEQILPYLGSLEDRVELNHFPLSSFYLQIDINDTYILEKINYFELQLYMQLNLYPQ